MLCMRMVCNCRRLIAERKVWGDMLAGSSWERDCGFPTRCDSRHAHGPRARPADADDRTSGTARITGRHEARFGKR